MKQQTMYDRIKARREDLQMTQDELAKLTGYKSKTSITKIEGGKVDLPQSKIVAFANALQTTVDYLMGSTGRTVANLFTPEFHKVPIVGQIACGQPILAEQNIDGYANVTDIKCDYALRCKGDSMNPTLHDGDLVLIRQQPDVIDGQIAAVLIGEEATLKHLYHIADGILLVSDNPQFPPMTYTGEKARDASVIGLAVGYQRLIR